jgi:hypothetical protein
VDQLELVSAPMSKGECQTLKEYERAIDRGLTTFYAVGTALAAIRDGRLYRETHNTFEEYCRERWGFTRMRASQMIAASAVYENVNHGLQPPATERQARPLTALPAEQQAAVWQKAVESAPNGTITAEHVARTVRNLAFPHAVHHSSDRNDWCTPKHIIDTVTDFLDEIDLDPCSNSKEHPNVPARQRYTVEDDGLTLPWWGRVYMNPPYGDTIGLWVERMVTLDRARDIECAVALLPARPGSAWFKLLRDCALCFIDGRLTFVGADSGAPFPSVLAYTGDEWERFRDAVAHLGDVFRRMP